MSAEWWCCTFSALRSGIVQLAFMVFGRSWMVNANRWPGIFGAFKFTIL